MNQRQVRWFNFNELDLHSIIMYSCVHSYHGYIQNVFFMQREKLAESFQYFIQGLGLGVYVVQEYCRCSLNVAWMLGHRLRR